MSPRYQSGLLQPPTRLSLVGPRGGIIMPMGSQLSADFSQQQWNNMVAKKGASQYNKCHRSLSVDNQQPTVSNQAMFAQQQQQQQQQQHSVQPSSMFGQQPAYSSSLRRQLSRGSHCAFQSPFGSQGLGCDPLHISPSAMCLPGLQHRIYGDKILKKSKNKNP